MDMPKSKFGKMRLTKFRRAVILDRARRDISGREFRKGQKYYYSAGSNNSSSGVVFTGKELLRAKQRSLRLRGLSK